MNETNRDDDVLWMLFSFEGRMTRRYLWAGMVLQVSLLVVSLQLLSMVLDGAYTLGASMQFCDAVGAVGMWLALVAGVRSYLGLCIKRFHDLGYSGWFTLATLVPGVGGLAALALLFLPGSPGSNAWGEPMTPSVRGSAGAPA